LPRVEHLPIAVGRRIRIKAGRANSLAQSLDPREVRPQPVEVKRAREGNERLDPAGAGIVDRERRQQVRRYPEDIKDLGLNVIGLRQSFDASGRLRYLDGRAPGGTLADMGFNPSAPGPDRQSVLRQFAGMIEQPDCAYGGVPAHRHLMIGHPKAKLEVAVGIRRGRQHKAALMAIGPGDLLHLGVRHADRIDDDGSRIASARTRGKYADKLDVLISRHIPPVGVSIPPG
jgi:hypothetical protein